MDIYLVRWKGRFLGPLRTQGRDSESSGVLRLFTRQHDAEDYHAACEQNRSAPLFPGNPFEREAADPACANLANLQAFTSLPEEVLHDWVLDAYIQPPELPGKYAVTLIPRAVPRRALHESRRLAWFQWWKSNAQAMTVAQQTHVFKALDRVRFFEVVTVPMHWK